MQFFQNLRKIETFEGKIGKTGTNFMIAAQFDKILHLLQVLNILKAFLVYASAPNLW